MSWQAMHEKCVLAGLRKEVFIHLIWTENFDTFSQFVLLAHAGPDIRVHGISSHHIVR